MTPTDNRAFAAAVTARLLDQAGIFDGAVAQTQVLLQDLAVSRERGGRMSRRGNIVRGADKGRIIFTETVDGVRRELHATKGWRTRRVAAG